MNTKPTIPKRTEAEQALHNKAIVTKLTKVAALVLAFSSVYYFFIKLLFL